ETGLHRFHYSVAHNGRLEWRHTKEKSDTRCFVEDFLTPMLESHPFALTYEWASLAMERTLTFGGCENFTRANKMAIMMLDREDGAIRTFILNPRVSGINGAG